MTDSQNENDRTNVDDLVAKLSSADPQDAPIIAEALADELADQLSSTEVDTATEQGTRS